MTRRPESRLASNASLAITLILGWIVVSAVVWRQSADAEVVPVPPRVPDRAEALSEAPEQTPAEPDAPEVDTARLYAPVTLPAPPPVRAEPRHVPAPPVEVAAVPRPRPEPPAPVTPAQTAPPVAVAFVPDPLPAPVREDPRPAPAAVPKPAPAPAPDPEPLPEPVPLSAPVPLTPPADTLPRPSPAPEVSPDRDTVREGRTLLKLMERGEGPDIEIAWPTDAAARARLYEVFEACFGMRSVVVDAGGKLYAADTPPGQPWKPNPDRVSGYARQPQGELPLPERVRIDAIRARHGITGGHAIRVFPREADAMLLGALGAVATEDYRAGKSFRAVYEVVSSGVRVGSIEVEGRPVGQPILLSALTSGCG